MNRQARSRSTTARRCAGLGWRRTVANTRCALGSLASAQALHEQVLAACHWLLGQEHPDTLTSMNNLAGTLTN